MADQRSRGRINIDTLRGTGCVWLNVNQGKNQQKITGDTRVDPRPGQPFTPEILDRSIITPPLLKVFYEEELRLESNKGQKPQAFRIIIELNSEYPGGRHNTSELVSRHLSEIIYSFSKDRSSTGQGIDAAKSRFVQQYIFATLEAKVVRELARRCTANISPPTLNEGGSSPIAHIWPDFQIRGFQSNASGSVDPHVIVTSPSFGEGVVWAVIDSGIDGDHRHFKLFNNLSLPPPLFHLDFTGSLPLEDRFGHGTHAAGIIAGTAERSKTGEKQSLTAAIRERDELGRTIFTQRQLDQISGVAPKCKLISLKVIDDVGAGPVSNVIAALATISEFNSDGRRLVVHGVYIGVGHEMETEWLVSGPSPLVREVDQLVRSGVTVVVADGTPIAGFQLALAGRITPGEAFYEPGNAELVISVRSTIRNVPRATDKIYFIPKRVVDDDYDKPDMIASLQNVISCSSGQMDEMRMPCDYVEASGSSVAAAHISGTIAAFLSVRKEFIGQPERIKRKFLSPQGVQMINSGVTSESLSSLGSEIKKIRIFVSYSHTDKAWLERLRVHLGPLQRQGTLDFWDDSRIKTGERWKEKIEEALRSAQIAILLISADFLASDFIQSSELPQLLAAAEAEGVRIMPVIIKPSLFKQTKSISQFQALNPPDKPLINLSEGEQEAYWYKLAEEIARLTESG